MAYLNYSAIKPFNILKGKTLLEVIQSDANIQFKCSDGTEYLMAHSQDCCESVYIESIVGELADLIGAEVLVAEESHSDVTPADYVLHSYEPDSQTWTFYKLATVKGYVDIRWLGTSNGYYSEAVDLYEVKE